MARADRFGPAQLPRAYEGCGALERFEAAEERQAVGRGGRQRCARRRSQIGREATTEKQCGELPSGSEDEPPLTVLAGQLQLRAAAARGDEARGREAGVHRTGGDSCRSLREEHVLRPTRRDQRWA